MIYKRATRQIINTIKPLMKQIDDLIEIDDLKQAEKLTNITTSLNECAKKLMELV